MPRILPVRRSGSSSSPGQYGAQRHNDSSFSYKLDPVGNRKRVTEIDGSIVTWAYDNTYQLLGERRWGSNSYAITYTYDPAGNRLTQRNSGTPTTYTYDVANELLTQSVATGRTTFSYDANGNQTLQTASGGARTTWTWDFENRPTLVQLSTGIVDTFTYNADGQRVQKQDSTGTTNHIWDLENILEETNQSNVTQVIYTLQPVGYGNVVSQDRKGTVRFYLFDGLGSADRLAGPTGLVTDNYVYEAFGAIAFTHGPTINPFKYIGRLGYYWDTDLAQDYVRARYYNPSLGRFLSVDPLVGNPWITRSLLGESIVSPRGVQSRYGCSHSPLGCCASSLDARTKAWWAANQYAYADNSPTVLVDPQGCQAGNQILRGCQTTG